MALWRPRQTQDERLKRAIRSMQNGSMDGRVISAYPVKPRIMEDDYESEFEDELEEDADDVELPPGGVGGDASSIKPWTDYLTVKNTSPVHNFALTKTPWVQPEMSISTGSYSSVHLYWNGVLQRDISYSLDGSIITILDDRQDMRPSDTITVKYFFDLDGGQLDENMIRLECWFDSFSPKENRPGYYIFWDGIMEAPPTGSNFGKIKATAGRYQTLQSTGNWTCKYRNANGQKLPVGDDVAGITWRLSFDESASCRAFIGVTPGTGTSNYWNHQGTNFGTMFCHHNSCDIMGASCGPNELPTLLASSTAGPFNPSLGPIGGRVFASGEQGKVLAKHLNYNNRSESIRFEMPKYPGRVPHNDGGCTYGGGESGDDTLYGWSSYEVGTYDLKIGVTATVVMK